MSAPSVGFNAAQPKWSVQPNATFINSTAVSDNASRVVAGTFYHNYTSKPGPSETRVFGMFCYDGSGNLQWSDAQQMFEGVYWVAISGNGQVAAASGWSSAGQGLLRAYNASNGASLLNYTAIKTRVSAVALTQNGSLLLAATSTEVYLFAQDSQGVFSAPPSIMPMNGNFAESIAIDPAGNWFALCDNQGYAYLVTIKNGAIGKAYGWRNPSGQIFHSVAVAGQGNYFAAGGDDGTIYVFDPASMVVLPQPTAQFPIATAPRIRWVAMSGDGSLISAVGNQSKGGELDVLAFDGTNLALKWSQLTLQDPNSTSIDALGQYVSVADGFQGPGDFYMFDASGKPRWRFTVPDMCWPMFLSADGSAAVAGGDNGRLYYFVP